MTAGKGPAMISKRIQAIAGAISDPDCSVIDIGCDHAYLLIWLRRHGHRGRLAGTELRPGPWARGKADLERCGCGDIELFLTDGVQGIREPFDVAVIAGMGRHTAEKILEQSDDWFRRCRSIILQVNQDVPELRRWISDHRYHIVAEQLVEDGKYYEILVIRDGGEPLTEQQIRFGPRLLQEKSPLFVRRYRSLRDQEAALAARIPEGDEDRQRLSQDIAAIEKILG
jgi:tRNA (adenine22-N1)-methyltransferase